MMSMLMRLFVAATMLSRAEPFQFPSIKFSFENKTREVNTAPKLILSEDAARELRERTRAYCLSDSCFHWCPDAEEGYQVAKEIFETLSSHQPNHQSKFSLVLSFPSANQGHLSKLADAINSDRCKELLGLSEVHLDLCPRAPAPLIRIQLPRAGSEADETMRKQSISTSKDKVREATEDWVNNFLGRHNLCPYTSSVTRAATGLASVNVPVGRVHIRVDGAGVSSEGTRQARRLVSSFWSEVAFLLESPPSEYATSLVVFPGFDNDFDTFFELCDGVVEQTVAATDSTDFIGRAWFHPRYEADVVGHADVIAGHAIPHRQVAKFMSRLVGSGELVDSPLEYDKLVVANDLVRRTPHATINILRRAQLQAAGEFEKGLGDKRPKANSIYVRNAIRVAKHLNTRGASETE